MPREAQEPKVTTPPADVTSGDEQQTPDGDGITYQDMVVELTTMLGEKDQQLAGLRIISKRQQAAIARLQEELIKKGD
jgi:hypothetical protein